MGVLGRELYFCMEQKIPNTLTHNRYRIYTENVRYNAVRASSITIIVWNNCVHVNTLSDLEYNVEENYLHRKKHFNCLYVINATECL